MHVSCPPQSSCSKTRVSAGRSLSDGLAVLRLERLGSGVASPRSPGVAGSTWRARFCILDIGPVERPRAAGRPARLSARKKDGRCKCKQVQRVARLAARSSVCLPVPKGRAQPERPAGKTKGARAKSKKDGRCKNGALKDSAFGRSHHQHIVPDRKYGR